MRISILRVHDLVALDEIELVRRGAERGGRQRQAADRPSLTLWSVQAGPPRLGLRELTQVRLALTAQYRPAIHHVGVASG